MAMTEVLRSGVNTWDCDQMGHMNVRHYFAKANQGLTTLALMLGLPPSQLRRAGQALRARDQHVRFLRELRPGSYYTLRAGVVQASPAQLHVYEELSVLNGGEVAASMLSEVTLVEAASGRSVEFPAAVLERARDFGAELPAATAPRGIARSAPRTPPVRQDALDRGMLGGYLAPVQPEDCDASGRMHEAAFMARVSDGIGHFFHAMHGPRALGVGGAALEYRFVFHQRPALGDVIEVRSGLKSLGNKTRHLCHWIFDLETGRCAATSEAVAVSFDLTTRKAIDISPEGRAELERWLIADLSV